MEEFFDIIIAFAAIGAIIIRMAKKAQEQKPKQPTFEELEDEIEVEIEETPIFQSETFQRTTRSTEYAKNKDIFVSYEGSESDEGKCIEPDANHCAVEHVEDEVFQTEIADEKPARFNRENFVQGIIMAEILSKSKWKE